MVISVTGHRDLIDSEITKIEVEVKEFLDSFSGNLTLYSALAEGADILVARVAKELGIELKVLLPYKIDEYIKSFEYKKSLDEFNKLLQYASSIEVVCDITTNSPTICYEKLGYELCDRADILLALWNGIDNNKKGGTADVVKYFRQTYKNRVLKVVNVSRKLC